MRWRLIAFITILSNKKNNLIKPTYKNRNLDRENGEYYLDEVGYNSNKISFSRVQLLSHYLEHGWSV